MQQKTVTILISSVLLFAGVGVFLLMRKRAVLTPQPAAKNDGTPQPLSDAFIQAGLDKSNALLQKKRALYEAKWKKSGTLLSFKDWYIENAE
jgi:hypothetical protein